MVALAPVWASQRARNLPRVGSRISDERSARLGELGRDVLDLHAHPKRALPEHVGAAATEAARSNGVAPSRGLPSLRAALAERLTAELGHPVDPDTNVLLTAGAMHALDVVLATVLDQG